MQFGITVRCGGCWNDRCGFRSRKTRSPTETQNSISVYDVCLSPLADRRFGVSRIWSQRQDRNALKLQHSSCDIPELIQCLSNSDGVLGLI